MGSLPDIYGNISGKIGNGFSDRMVYAVQGVVSIFMPALMGIVADRWVPAQRLLGFCHLMAALFMFGAAYMGMTGNLGMVFGSTHSAWPSICLRWL